MKNRKFYFDSMLRHKESGDPLCLPAPIRFSVYNIRDALIFPFTEGKDVLDLGCGWGYDTYLLSQKAKKVTGVDVNKTSIDLASKRYAHIPNIEFVNDSILHFLDTGKKFDVVVLFESLEHLSFKEQTLLVSKLPQILRDSGQIFLSTPNGKHVPFYRRNPYHKGELTLDQLGVLLSRNFRIRSVKGQIPLVWFYIPLPWNILEKFWIYLGIYEKVHRANNNPQNCRTLILRAVIRPCTNLIP